MEMIIAVPYKMAMNVNRAMAIDDLRKIITENQDTFGEKGCKNYSTHLIMTLFLLYEN
jgi:hypothetical protein